MSKKTKRKKKVNNKLKKNNKDISKESINKLETSIKNNKVNDTKNTVINDIKNNKAKENNSKKVKKENKCVKDNNKIETNNDVKENKKHFFKDIFIQNLVFVHIMIFLIEILFKAISKFPLFNYSTLRIFISTFTFSLIITFISSLTKRKWLRNTINLIFIFIYSLYAWLQLGFINYLGVYISFNTSSQFGAVTDYIKDYLMSFKLIYFVIFIPFLAALIVYLIFSKKREYNKLIINKKHLYLLLVLFISIDMYYLTLTLPFMQNDFQIKSNKKLFINPDVPTIAVNQFGTTVFGILDLKSYIFPVSYEDTFVLNNEIDEKTTKREVSSLLDDLSETEEDDKYNNLNKYYASQNIVDYNDYTGLFENKNVVVILMESVNNGFINEEYFPNFTKLYNEGWHWENNYSPRNSCATGNNEFSAMTGLYSIYNSCTSNVYKENTYYQSIFNLFNNKGYNTLSMHNFSEWYYKRSTIHKNMYSNAFYGPKELDIKTPSYYGEWTSDVEFFEKGFDIILNEDNDSPFMAWLTTVSTHQPYSVSSTYGDMYQNDFKKLGYSNTTSRYLSKLKVLDNAIGVMLDKLDEKNMLDDTVIVLLADHYPYGLSQNQIKEIIDGDLSDYEIEKTPFVIYNPELKSTTYTEYTSYINLVPTLANLFNLEYDPRLYMGTDLLSDDYESRVIFADGSWKNEIAYYNASTSNIKYYTEKLYTTEEIQNINNIVNLKISMSSKSIKNNYFNYLENKLKENNDDKED